MPKAKKTNRKRNYRRRNYRKNTGQMRMGQLVRPKTYGFSRTREHLLALEAPDGGWLTTLDGSCVRTVTWSLNELPQYTEFVNLFDKYKLNYCRMKFYPSYSQVVSSTSAVASVNYVITVWPNTNGQSLTAAFDQDALNQIQRKKQWMFPLNKPTTVSMYLKQLNSVFGGTINTDYTIKKPSYISTLEPGTPHYGMNIHIRKVDGTAFGSNSARLLIKEKIYLTTNQVK